MFVPRSVYIVYEQDETFEGLPARRFILPKSVLENRTNAPENECFCLDENDEGKCPDTGALFLGACYEGKKNNNSKKRFTVFFFIGIGDLVIKTNILTMLNFAGAPLIGSNPHFYNGHEKYINGVEGLSPQKSKHETTIILEQVGFYFNAKASI